MNRGIFLLAAFAFVACVEEPVAPATPKTHELSPVEFRDGFIDALRERSPDAVLEPTGDLQLSYLNNNTDVQGTYDLLTGYEEYRRNPEAFDDILEKWINVIVGGAEPDGPLSERLVFVARHRDYLSQIPAASDGIEEAVWRPIGGDQLAIMMADSPTSLRMVTARYLAEEGIEQSDAWRLAETNLRTRIGSLQLGDLNGDGPFAYSSESGLATGLIAHPDACGPNAAQPEDGRVVLVLDRNTYISTLPNDSLSVQRFWKFARAYLGTGQLMSETPLTCRDGRWEIVTPPA